MKTALEILYEQLEKDEINFVEGSWIDDSDRAFDSIVKAMEKFAEQEKDLLRGSLDPDGQYVL